MAVDTTGVTLLSSLPVEPHPMAHVGYNFVFIFIFLLGQGGPNELLDLVDTDAYWQARGIQQEETRLIALLRDPVDVDVAGLIPQLGHEDFQKRKAAADKIRAAGAGAAPHLEKAVTDDDPEVIELEAEGKTASLRAAMPNEQMLQSMSMIPLMFFGTRSMQHVVPPADIQPAVPAPEAVARPPAPQ